MRALNTRTFCPVQQNFAGKTDNGRITYKSLLNAKEVVAMQVAVIVHDENKVELLPRTLQQTVALCAGAAGSGTLDEAHFGERTRSIADVRGLVVSHKNSIGPAGLLL